MRKLASALSIVFIAAIAVVSSADPPSPVPAPDPAPSPSPGGGGEGDCKECAKCVGACADTFSACARRCNAQPDADSQKACAARCQQPLECGRRCPCKGCGIPVH